MRHVAPPSKEISLPSYCIPLSWHRTHLEVRRLAGLAQTFRSASGVSPFPGLAWQVSAPTLIIGIETSAISPGPWERAGTQFEFCSLGWQLLPAAEAEKCRNSRERLRLSGATLDLRAASRSPGRPEGLRQPYVAILVNRPTRSRHGGWAGFAVGCSYPQIPSLRCTGSRSRHERPAGCCW